MTLSLLRFTVERMARNQRPDLSEWEIVALAETALRTLLRPDHIAEWQGAEALVTLEAANECLPDSNPTANWRAEYRRWAEQSHTPLFFLERGERQEPDPAITGGLALLDDLDRQRVQP